MATVVNKARPEEGVDPSYDAPNRKLAASPQGVTMSLYAGEIVLDYTDGVLYRAEAMDTSAWTPVQVTKS